MTAVEWIIDQLRQLSHSLEADLGMGDIRVTQGMLDDFEEQAKKMEKEQNKKEKCWVIRNSAKHILCVHKTINDEQLKDYRKQGLYTDEYILSDCFISINPSRYNEDTEQYYKETYGSTRSESKPSKETTNNLPNVNPNDVIPSAPQFVRQTII